MSEITRRSAIAAGVGFAAGSAALPYRSARAQAANTIRIGVMTDMSGTYRDNTGPTSVAATREAVAEFANRGFTAEVIEADHQNRPDVGVNLARQWYDQGVDLILDVPTSSVGLAVSTVAREKNKAYINVGSATADLTGAQCSPNTIHWAYDTYMLAQSTGGAMVRAGGDTWFFITADYAFGHALERDTANFVRTAGGRVLGQVRTPFPGTTDFSSFLVQAQSSRAKVIGFANAGADTQNCVKQAAEFGMIGKGDTGQIITTTLFDVPLGFAAGLEVARDLTFSVPAYWDRNDASRALAARLAPVLNNNPMAANHAGDYSGAYWYLKAAAGVGVAKAKSDGRAVIEYMKTMKIDDPILGRCVVRPDGRCVHEMLLMKMKQPPESKGPLDLASIVSVVPAERAFRPMQGGGCPMVGG